MESSTVVGVDPAGRSWVKAMLRDGNLYSPTQINFDQYMTSDAVGVLSALLGAPVVRRYGYVRPGEKITKQVADEFEALHASKIAEVALAAAERVSPFAVGNGPRITHFATKDGLMRWSGLSPYHRGLTEEYIVAASVTYIDNKGVQRTIPIRFVWETAEIEVGLDAERVGY